jgi:hypothetical protein
MHERTESGYTPEPSNVPGVVTVGVVAHTNAADIELRIEQHP